MNKFFTGEGELPLTLYRGEVEHASLSTPRRRGLRGLWFGDLETAHHYADYPDNEGEYKTSRIYPAHLVLKRPFVNTPNDPFLDLSFLIRKLGRAETERIARRFAKYIEETDEWRYRVNMEGKYASVNEYLNSIYCHMEGLYFQAHYFFDSQMEVNKLRRMGYDGAIIGGCGPGSASKPEYVVFDYNQVYSTISKTFLEKV